MREAFARRTVADLKQHARELGIQRPWKMNKRELIERLVEQQLEISAGGNGDGGGAAPSALSDADAEVDVPYTATELGTWSREELRDLAAKRNIENIKEMRKAELIAELCNASAPTNGTRAEDRYDASTLEPLAENDLFAVDPDLYGYLKESSALAASGVLPTGNLGGAKDLAASGAKGGELGALSGGGLGAALSGATSEHLLQAFPRQALQHITIGLVCGGPTAERGISLNSARAVLDHLKSDKTRILTYYVDPSLRTYPVSNAQLYSNTPSDFDFKLAGTCEPIATPEALVTHLKGSVDVVLPVLHGAWGEDGTLQALLEAQGVPFVGTSAAACAKAFDKAASSEEIAAAGFPSVPSFEVDGTMADEPASLTESLKEWAEGRGLGESGRYVVKPSKGGSSIGVRVVEGLAGAAEAVTEELAAGPFTRYLVQPYVTGREFTVNVIDTSKGPIALMPTEIEISPSEDPSEVRFFDFRSKYLPSPHVRMHTPPSSFSESLAGVLMRQAEDIFLKLELQDFARIDGWYLSEDEAATLLDAPAPFVFSDINIIPGLEQNSFIYRQASLVGLKHSGVLNQIMKSACSRWDLQFPEGKTTISPTDGNPHAIARTKKQKVWVLCGGETSERQVSLMSGLNAYLKLSKFSDLEVTPFVLAAPVSNREAYTAQFNALMRDRQALLDFGCSEDMLPASLQMQTMMGADMGATPHRGGLSHEDWQVWKVPRAGMLFHTVEEVDRFCTQRELDEIRSYKTPVHPFLAQEMTLQKYFGTEERTLLHELHDRLKAAGVTDVDENWNSVSYLKRQMQTTSMDLARFAEEASVQDAAVFLATHGGVGENGTIQALLESWDVKYTGSSPSACTICMDKIRTADVVARLAAEDVKAAPKKVLFYTDLLSIQRDEAQAAAEWDVLVTQLEASCLCIKPSADGCSTGVAKLSAPSDLMAYAAHVCTDAPLIEENTLSEAHGPIAMPQNPLGRFLVEPFIDTAVIKIVRHDEAVMGAEGGWPGDPSPLGAPGEGAAYEALVLEGDSRWIEVTVGLLGSAGQMKAMLPSVTVKELGEILTLEEKFQGGTGINLTPPPAEIVSKSVIKAAQMKLELTASLLGLSGFARIDAFLNVDTAELTIIEVNAIPGMTPSTVLFQQALAEDPPIFPETFFRMALDIACEEED